MPASDEFTCGVEDDAGIPPHSELRRALLSVLGPSDALVAAQLHEHWYHAAAAPEVWEDYFAASRSPHAREMDYTVALPSPSMYSCVLDVFTSRADDIRDMLSEDAAVFARSLAPVFTVRGCWLSACAVITGLMRMPQFIKLPPDALVREDCTMEKLHRLWLLQAQLLASLRSSPKPAAVPWLLSMYEWVARSPLAAEVGFHKMMLAPATMVLRCEVFPPRIHQVIAIILLTTEIIERFVKGRYLLFPSGLFAGSPKPLASTDPRNAYSIYVHVLLKFPECRSLVMEQVSVFGDVGIFELECARCRVQSLLAAAAMRSRSVIESVQPEVTARDSVLD